MIQLRPRLPARHVVVLIGVAVLTWNAPAWAHEDEASVSAREEVLQAIAYLVNTPENMDAISDKIADAQEADETSGVDLDLVSRAGTALEAEDMTRARDLLQRSIGAGVDVSGTDVRPILQVPTGVSSVALATGEESGTTVVTDEMAGRGALTSADLILLLVSVAVATVGVIVSVRFKPAHSIHRLQRLAGS